MGRKPAPQPLSLTTSNTNTSGSNPNSAVSGSAWRDDLATGAAASARSGVSQGVSLSPADSAAASAISSTRPSPFTSRFSPSKAAQAHNGNRSRRPSGSANNRDNSKQTNGTCSERDGPESAYHFPVDATLKQHQQPQHTPASTARDTSAGTAAPLRHVQTDDGQGSGTSKKSTRSGFFGFTRVTKSASQSHVPHQPEPRGRLVSRGNQALGPSKHRGISHAQHESLERSHPPRSNPSVSSFGDSEVASTTASAPTSAKRTKPKSFGLLGRSKSIKDKERISPREAPVPIPVSATSPELQANPAPPKTAPPSAQDRSFRDMMSGPNSRNRSEDRAPTRDGSTPKENHREREHKHMHLSHSHREAGGSTFFSGLRNSSTRAADMLSKGLFGKGTRSGSTTDREPVIDDEHYILRVINMPLVEQTRKTRISKRLEDSNDKTEFWMPAFPWRAIDYLNYNGCEVEGLYRVPGSGPQVKKWQRKFDEELDVNLFEQPDLYDINIVGSMLKAWLRELPDELFPKRAQERVSRECAGADKVPQLLVDELSNLSPYNYYLLFAITCHLSLLLAHSDKNKMDFRNLCICFQPCMKIDAFCFRFLVCDWRDCWQGCNSEAKYIEEEYKLLDQTPPKSPDPAQGELTSDRKLSSSSSSKPSEPTDEEPRLALNDKPLSNSESNGSMRSHSSISTNLTGNSEREREREREQAKANSNMRPLSPIKPLSPLGF